MGISLDVEDMRICLNEADEVGHPTIIFGHLPSYLV